MKRPRKKEIIEYFKNAKEVKCSSDGDVYIIDLSQKIETTKYTVYIENQMCKNDGMPDCCRLWNYELGYSEILTYKEKTFSITESQIKELLNIYCTQDKDDYIKELFPEAFESEVKSLPKDFTGWCKIHNMGNDNWIMYFENGIQQYGIDSNGNWFNESGAKIQEHYSEATEQEVFEALKKEAVKRGYKEKDVITDIYYSGWCALNANSFEYNRKCLWLGDCVLFKDGKWAEKTITLSEAEQQLGKKIIV